MLSDKPFQIPRYLLERCEKLPPLPTAVVGADNLLAMESAWQATEAALIEPILVGDSNEIAAIASAIGWDISGLRVVAADCERAAVEAAVALARGGEVAGLMKGHVHSDTLMRGVLDKAAGLRGDRRLSHIFHMTIPDRERVLFITDGAVNVAPDIETMTDIVGNAVDLAQALGNRQPRVAMLSGTETANDSMPSSVNAAKVVARLNSGNTGGAHIDGPFAFDNAISPEAATLKGIDGPVAGKADILAVPNIETGNGLFKMMVYFMSAVAAGVVMGARVPIMLTSRADPPEARLAAAAIAAIVAAQNGTK